MEELQKELQKLKIDKSGLYRSSNGKDVKGLRKLDKKISKVTKKINKLSSK